MKKRARPFSFIALGSGMAALAACSMGSPKSHYILAEKLWSDGRYAAAVAEFEKVVSKDPGGKLGLQSLLRAASTEAMFLAQYSDAIKKYRSYAQRAGGTPEAWEAKKEIGEILFEKTDQYDLAIQHYQQLLQEKPEAPEAPEFLFRVSKSQFYLWHFDESSQGYRELIQRFPRTSWAEKAAYELGTNAFTRGEQRPGGRGQGAGTEAYQEAINDYRGFLRRYPRSELVPQAKFGIASCLEELDLLDAAYQSYMELKATYPSPQVIEIKLARIRERKAQRSR